MVLLIIIPMKNGYFIGNIPYFQTNSKSQSGAILENPIFYGPFMIFMVMLKTTVRNLAAPIKSDVHETL